MLNLATNGNAEKMNKLPISEYQKRFFVEWALAPNESTYNTSLVFKITGNLDKVALKKACELFIQKHEICHAQYNEDGSECYYSNYTIDDFYHEIDINDNSCSESSIIDQHSFTENADPYSLTNSTQSNQEKYILQKISELLNNPVNYVNCCSSHRRMHLYNNSNLYF